MAVVAMYPVNGSISIVYLSKGLIFARLPPPVSTQARQVSMPAPIRPVISYATLIRGKMPAPKMLGRLDNVALARLPLSTLAAFERSYAYGGDVT